MIKKMIFAALALLATGMVYAQTEQTEENNDFTETVEYSNDKYKVETNRFWSNWFGAIGGGVNIYYGDHDKQMKFGKRLAPALDIAVGKWFTPGIGIRLMYSGLSVNGATQDIDGGEGPHSSGTPISGKPWEGYWLRNQDFNFFNFQADVLFNFSNLIGGYREDRFYQCSPYGGLGVVKVTDSPKETAVAGHFGVLNSFRLSPAFDLNLDIRGALVNDALDGEDGGRGGEGMLTASIGVAYKFKPRGWNRSKTIIRYDNRALNAMRKQLDEVTADNKRLRKALEAGNREKAEVIVKKIAAANLVIFPIGESTLSNEARVNLSMLAEVIKTADLNTVYTVTGYADSSTGSEDLNKRLSKERAQAVFDCLTKEFGVPANQLRMEYMGGVENMFYDDPRLSRAVITRTR